MDENNTPPIEPNGPMGVVISNCSVKNIAFSGFADPQQFFQKSRNYLLTIPSRTAIIPKSSDANCIWGYSSAGRALEWHSRGQRFDPAYLHQNSGKRKFSGVFLCQKFRFLRFLCHFGTTLKIEFRILFTLESH